MIYNNPCFEITIMTLRRKAAGIFSIGEYGDESKGITGDKETFQTG